MLSVIITNPQPVTGAEKIINDNTARTTPPPSFLLLFLVLHTFPLLFGVLRLASAIIPGLPFSVLYHYVSQK